MNYPIIDPVYSEVIEEIDRGNQKHGSGPLASPLQVVSILTEEVGEFAGEINRGNMAKARKELIQVAAVAINALRETGPHVTTK